MKKSIVEKLKNLLVVLTCVFLATICAIQSLMVAICLFNGMTDEALNNGVFAVIFYIAAHTFIKRAIKGNP